MKPKITLRETDIHRPLKARMDQRGIALNEIEITLNEGFDAQDAKEILGKKIEFELPELSAA